MYIYTGNVHDHSNIIIPKWLYQGNDNVKGLMFIYWTPSSSLIKILLSVSCCNPLFYFVSFTYCLQKLSLINHELFRYIRLSYTAAIDFGIIYFTLCIYIQFTHKSFLLTSMVYVWSFDDLYLIKNYVCFTYMVQWCKYIK